jgi:hypothetical protein
MCTVGKTMKPGMMELRELLYRARFLSKHYGDLNTEGNYIPGDLLPELELGVEYIKETIVSITKRLQQLWDLVDELPSTPMHIQELVQAVIVNKNLNKAVYTNFRLETDTIHIELSKEELSKAVLYFFKNDNYNTDAVRMYLAPLQGNLREMITLFDLSEEDYHQLMEEIIDPVMTRADWYTSTASILFELLRKKQMKAQWKRLEDIKC